MTGAALVALGAAVVVALAQLRRLRRDLTEQQWLFTGHLWAHERVGL